jgi:hypothetical protein
MREIFFFFKKREKKKTEKTDIILYQIRFLLYNSTTQY